MGFVCVYIVSQLKFTRKIMQLEYFSLFLIKNTVHLILHSISFDIPTIPTVCLIVISSTGYVVSVNLLCS